MPHVAAGTICLGQAKEIRAVLSEFGADPEEVIAEAGLDPRPALGALAHLCAERTGCPHFGLLVGQSADEIRYGIARQLLFDTDLPLVQISAALDFSEAAAFTRAFRRWSGAAPSTWRATRVELRRPG